MDLYFPICFRYHDTIERYCEDTDTWEIVSEMTTSRSWLSCVSLQLRKDIHIGSCTGTPSDSWVRETPIFPGYRSEPSRRRGSTKLEENHCPFVVTRVILHLWFSSLNSFSMCCICFRFWYVDILKVKIFRADYFCIIVLWCIYWTVIRCEI